MICRVLVRLDRLSRLTFAANSDETAPDTVKAVAACNDIARDLLLPPILREHDACRVGVDAIDLFGARRKAQIAARRQSRTDQILHHLVLAIHGDGASTGQLR